MKIETRYSDIPGVVIDHDRVPIELAKLIPLAKKWSIRNTDELLVYAESLSAAEKRETFDHFNPLFDRIAEWQESHESTIPKPDEVVLFEIATNNIDIILSQI